MQLVEALVRAQCVFLILAAAHGAAQEPPPSRDQSMMLARVRQESLRYQRELPDFICLQLTTRSVDDTGTGRHWKQQDKFEVEDSYVGRFVNHKLIQLNGKPPGKNYQQLSGFLSESVLYSVGFLPRWLFEPQAKTQFQWVRAAEIDGRPVQVFTVHLDPSDSKFMIASEMRSVRAGSTDRRSIAAGIDGLLYVDSVAARVRRFEIRMILPPESVIQEGAVDIDYGGVTISGREFLLPIKFEVRARFGDALGKNDTEVVRYQKYAAKSTIHFDDAPSEGAPPGP